MLETLIGKERREKSKIVDFRVDIKGCFTSYLPHTFYVTKEENIIICWIIFGNTGRIS